MSERGSFTTEYIYCDDCLDVLAKHLAVQERFLCGVKIGHGIIAGFIRGLGPGDEFLNMEHDRAVRFENELCHRVRIAVLAENGESRIMAFGPDNEL